MAWGGIVCTAIACGLVLAGCGTAPRAAGDEATVAAEPVYRVGDRFTFDNPLVTWEVVAIEGDRVRWRSNGGDEQVTGFNPLMPVLEWASSRHGHGQRIISDRQGALFPMRVSAKMAFRASVDTDRPPYRWTFDWMCEVLEKATVDSALGPVDAFKVACGRQQPNEMTFLYAPSIGHYVRMESSGANGEAPLVRRLVSFSRDTGTAVASRSKADRRGTELGWAVDEPPAQPSPQRSPTAVPMIETVALTSLEDNRANRTGAERPMVQPETKPLPVAPVPRAKPASTPPEPASLPPPAVAELPPVEAAPVEAPVEAPSAGTASTAAPRSETASESSTPMEPAQLASIPPAAARTDTAADSETSLPATEGLAIYLASYRNPQTAERGWRQLLSGNEDLLADLRPVIRRVDLGEKGAYYRLQAVPVESERAGIMLCRQLKARGAYCEVTKP